MWRSRRIPDGSGEASAPLRGPALIRIGYAVVGLTLFVAYLIATFPYSTTLSRILAPMGLAVSSESQSASFPFGARLEGVRLRSTRPGTAGLILESPAVTIAPSFLSMLMLHPGVRIKAALFDGIVRATIRPSSGGTAINFEVDSVDLAHQHLFAIPGADAAGRLTGIGSLMLSSGGIAESGDGDLNAAGLRITPALATGPINCGDGHSTFKLDQGTLTIEQFTTSGGDLNVNAQGTVELAPDPGESALSIQFTLSTAPAATSQLAALLAILPHPPGPQPYRLTGTLNEPRIS